MSSFSTLISARPAAALEPAPHPSTASIDSTWPKARCSSKNRFTWATRLISNPTNLLHWCLKGIKLYLGLFKSFTEFHVYLPWAWSVYSVRVMTHSIMEWIYRSMGRRLCRRWRTIRTQWCLVVRRVWQSRKSPESFAIETTSFRLLDMSAYF